MQQKQRPIWKPWHKIVLGIVGGLFVLVCVVSVIAVALAPDEESEAQGAIEETVPLVDGLEIVAAFAEAGLPATDPRDNTDNGWCEDTYGGCVQMITTDDITVLVYADAATASAFAEADNDLVDVYTDGPVVLSYAAARTPEDLRPEYEAVLAEFLG